MEREAVLVGIDVGTSKVCALIGEVSRDGRLTIMGHGTVPASGLKKGVVINIDQTVRSIADAVEKVAKTPIWVLVGAKDREQTVQNCQEMAAALAKYRINPGNVGARRHDEHFATIKERLLDAIVENLQKYWVDHPTHINVGQWYAPLARRTNIDGNLTAPVPVFWNVAKTGR